MLAVFGTDSKVREGDSGSSDGELASQESKKDSEKIKKLSHLGKVDQDLKQDNLA